MRDGIDQAPPPAMDSLEDLRAWLHKVHDISIGPDDPILMVHTLHTVALSEYRRMLDGHLEVLKAETRSGVMGERMNAIHDTARLADRAQDRFRRNIRLLVGLTVLNWFAVGGVLGLLVQLMGR